MEKRKGNKMTPRPPKKPSILSSLKNLKMTLIKAQSLPGPLVGLDATHKVKIALAFYSSQDFLKQKPKEASQPASSPRRTEPPGICAVAFMPRPTLPFFLPASFTHLLPPYWAGRQNPLLRATAAQISGIFHPNPSVSLGSVMV